ncbi:hypothetical protein ACHQM5_017868 [Ranunculus cassubicifolius]
MDIIASVGSSFTSCLCKPNHSNATTVAVDQRQHMISATKGARRLGKLKMKLLSQVVVANTMLQGEKGPHSNIQKWLDDVKDILAKTEVIEQKIRLARKGLRILLPGCCSHSNLGQRISELIKEVSALLEAGGKLSGDSLGLPVSETGMELPTRKIVGELKAKKTLEMVWKCLIDDESWAIGVWGMGGVGKTTIMKVLNNRLVKEEQHFSKVIWVTISKNMNIRRLQDEIAKEVGLTLSHKQDEVERSSLLRDELSAMGRFVLILDDMWEAFPLHQIGIPDFTGDSGSKFVLTSRSLEVCQMMECKENIKVELLLEEDAWELFVEIVGTEIPPEVENIARDVAKECSGLPLAILAIASAMRGKKTDGEWRVALRDLRESTKWIVNMEDKVIARLKFSYNYLGDDILKSCFLYCAFYPEDWRIDTEELIDHWIMDGLIHGRSIEDELDQGHIVLNNLKSSCMIEDNSEYDSDGVLDDNVKIHDLIRDMSLLITNVNPRFMVKAGADLEILGDDVEWLEDSEKVSFMHSHLHEILISPKCSEMRTLLLNGNPSLHYITHGFFLQMQGLRVLNLSKTGVKSLPESISVLMNLHVLDLSWCEKLKVLFSVEKLQSLRVLRLGHSAIEELPYGMEALVNLERLDLTDTNLREISSHLILKFPFLRELLLRVLNISNFSGSELQGLTHLESLSFRFPSLSDYTYYASSENFKHLKYFSLSVGDATFIDIPMSSQNRGRGVYICNDSNQMSSTILLPEKSEYLCLEKFHDFKRLSELVASKDMRELRNCYITVCSGVEHVMVSEEAGYLQYLERLEMSSCPNLITLYNGVPSRGCFPCLKELDLSFCQNLSYLFSSKLFKQLRQLVQVGITYCHKLEHLVISSKEEEKEGEGTNAGSTDTTCGLKILRLDNLPMLMNLFSSGTLHYFHNLENLRMQYCVGMEELLPEVEEVTSVANTTMTLPRLKKLQLTDMPNLKRVWNGYLPYLEELEISKCPELSTLFKGLLSSGSIPCLKKLVIVKCNKLSHLFSSKLFKQLKNLVEIEISQCENMELLIVKSEDDEKEEKTCEGECSLEKLNLTSLPNLKTLFSRDMLPYLQNLKEIRVVGSYAMEQLMFEEQVTSEWSCSSSSHTTMSLPKLNVLYLESLSELKNAWTGCLPQLKDLYIGSCPKLINLTDGGPSSVILDVGYCNELEVLMIESDEEELTGEGDNRHIASRTSSLKELIVTVVPKLKVLFSRRMLEYFQNLVEIRINDCKGMEELIFEEEQEISDGTNMTVALPRLKRLQIGDLPKLKSIWKGVMICNSLQTVQINSCDELKRLPQFCGQGRFPPPSLREFKGEREWWEALESDHSYLQSHFKPVVDAYDSWQISNARYKALHEE